MYEVACRNCGRVTVGSFIRAGAVVTCAGCEQRFQVQPDKLIRKVQINDTALGELLELMPAVNRPAVTPTTTEVRVPDATAPATGESVMPQAPPVQPAPPPAPAAPAPAPTPRPPTRRPPTRPKPEVPEPLPVTPSAPRPRKTRAPWSTIYALGASLLVTAVLIVALVVAALDGGGGGRTTASANGDNAAPFDPALPVLTAQALPLAEWEALDEPAGDLRTEDCPVQITDERFVRPPGVTAFVLYQARAVPVNPDLIAQSTLQLTLLDAEGMAYARAKVAMHLINPQEGVPVVVTLPSALRQNMALLGWKTTVEEVWAGAVPIQDAVVQPFGTGRRTQVRVKAFNPLTAPMKDLVFVMTAAEPSGRVVAQWRIACEPLLGPRRSMEFMTLTPVDTVEPLTWSIRGAGVPGE